MKRPAFQFYPADWRKDVELRSCPVDARGLWIDLLCIAHECEPYGHLVLNGKPMTAANIAGQIGGMTAAQVQRLIGVLIDNGVARTLDDGTIYSKRMVEDERIRNARAEGGKAGSEHGIKGAEHGSKGGRPKVDKGGSETPLPPTEKPPPSSSSSSSASPEDISVASQPRADQTNAAIEACPHVDLIRLFSERVPDLPKPRAELVNATRKRLIASRWRWVMTATREDGRRYADDKATAMEWFRSFFDKVADSDFLTGRNGRFKACSIDWLMTERNFNKVIEGNYDNKDCA